MSKKKFLPRTEESQAEALASRVRASTAGLQLVLVPLDKIVPNPAQPRARVDETSLVELADSIRTHGILEPLIGTFNPDGTYTLIAGHRRYQAAREANLHNVPVILHQTEGDDFLLLAMVENLQREDLHPIDEIRALGELVNQLGTQEKTALALGMPRSTLANRVRLLDLGKEVLDLCANLPEITFHQLAKLWALPEEKRLAAVRLLSFMKPAANSEPKPLVNRANSFRFSNTERGNSFRVEVKFRKGEATSERIISALEKALADAKAQIVSS